MRSKKISFFLWLTLPLGIILSAIQLLNKFIFSRCGRRNLLNSVWKSEYGDIAFTQAGSGPPLLLVHSIGIGSGSSEWDKNIEALSATRTVYALDLPGFGNSEKCKMTYNSYYYARVINEFICKIIGEKPDVAALCGSSGIVLAGAALSPRLYNSITVMNPYGEDMGSIYRENMFVRKALPFPVIGTLVYNFISSRQSVLAFLEKSASVSGNYREIKNIMEKRYKNAHRFGVNNKYVIISLMGGYLDTPVFSLMEHCPVKLNVLISGDSPYPMLPEKEGLSIIEIKDCGLYPNMFSGEVNSLL